MRDTVVKNFEVEGGVLRIERQDSFRIARCPFKPLVYAGAELESCNSECAHFGELHYFGGLKFLDLCHGKRLKVVPHA